MYNLKQNIVGNIFAVDQLYAAGLFEEEASKNKSIEDSLEMKKEFSLIALSIYSSKTVEERTLHAVKLMNFAVKLAVNSDLKTIKEFGEGIITELNTNASYLLDSAFSIVMVSIIKYGVPQGKVQECFLNIFKNYKRTLEDGRELSIKKVKKLLDSFVPDKKEVERALASCATVGV